MIIFIFHLNLLDENKLSTSFWSVADLNLLSPQCNSEFLFRNLSKASLWNLYLFIMRIINHNFIWWQSFKKTSQVWEGELRTVFQLLVTRSFSTDLFAEWNHHKSDIRILNLQKTMIDKVNARQVLIYVYVKLYWEKQLMEIRFVVSCAFNVTVSS